MKRLINPLPTGGVPFENEDILALQNEGFDSLKQILAGYTGAFVLSGCGSVLGSANYYGSTQAVGIGYLVGNPSITVVVPAGYVWIDGDIKYFPGYTGATPFYIKSDITTNTKKTLEDGTLKNVYATTNAVGTNTKPTSGQYINCNPTPEFTFGDMVNAKLQVALNAEINTRQNQIANEIITRSSADTQLSQQLTALSDVVNTKVTKKIAGTNWTDLDLTAGFTTDSTLGYNKAQMKRTEDGFVHLRGIVNFTLGSTGTFANIPSGFGTTKSTRINIGSVTDEFRVSILTLNSTLLASIDSNIPANAYLSFLLDGISYYADGTGGVQ